MEVQLEWAIIPDPGGEAFGWFIIQQFAVCSQRRDLALAWARASGDELSVGGVG
jgi:hypothetical protein